MVMTNKSTSPVAPPSRKAAPSALIPDDYVAPRWSTTDLRRVLALSTMGTVIFGVAFFNWRSGWLLWPAGFSALVLQVSASMIAARAAVASDTARKQRRAARKAAAVAPAPVPVAPPIVEADSKPFDLLGFLLGDSDPAPEPAPEPAAKPDDSSALQMPRPSTVPFDATLHRAFFRRIVDAEFKEHPGGLVWPDLGALQGSLATRLRLFQRHQSTAPTPAVEISEHERGPHSPWHHLGTYDGESYRRGDVMARMSHRAFAPLAFLELHVRIDMEDPERAALDEELARQYTLALGRVLTPPSLLSAVEPIRHRLGGSEAIALADDARLALRAASDLDDTARVRGEWRTRARVAQGVHGWSGEVLSIVEALVDYWYVQRAAAEDIAWAEELARLNEGTIGAALALRDAQGTFRFAEALQTVISGAAPRIQLDAPTAAATVA
jgi:hypothetical protein